MTTLGEHVSHPSRFDYMAEEQELFITYDIRQVTRSGASMQAKVKRIAVEGEIKECTLGFIRRKSGREVFALQVTYATNQKNYRTGTFSASKSLAVRSVEIPEDARNIQLYGTLQELPEKYRSVINSKTRRYQ